MRTWTRRSALTLAALSAAAVTLTGMGAASAAPVEPSSSSVVHVTDTPRQDVPFGSLQECQTYGNIMAQMGMLHSYTCTPSGGRYIFHWS
ncbi:hypothetical protein [Streptomyces varsoviensis]|uniref:Uncharacterized protein n=1 Tax=Streptomyces varsoviensis TaxID=67373 RepID=A0ABR5JET9_9ACTN|nr:hypothetical protein [Streptomyces varsoviensis]KOG91919.1 hypothetical protein ADK38_00515 [Streptomyces varsoviensis]